MDAEHPLEVFAEAHLRYPVKERTRLDGYGRSAATLSGIVDGLEGATGTSTAQ